MNKPEPRVAAAEIFQQRFFDAKVALLAGSVLRGDGTEFSDLDLVVIYDHVAFAYRDSFFYAGWPVEVFIHDRETLRYFYEEVDGIAGIPALASMVTEGLEIPVVNDFSRSIKREAQVHLDTGPKKWTQTDFVKSRYLITDVCDDLRAPRNAAEKLASLGKLHDLLGDFYFRSRGLWSAKGKSLPRLLAKADPDFFVQFSEAFQAAAATDDLTLALSLAQQMLAPHGGFLFADYRLDAPAHWRKADPKTPHILGKIALLRASPEDADALAELAGQLGYPVTTPEMRDRIAAIQCQDATAEIWIARNGGEEKILGWIHLAREPLSALVPAKAEILALVVDQAERGKGIGSTLVKFAEIWAKERGILTVRVRSNIARKEAHRFYQREGYSLGKTSHVFTKDLD